MKTKTLIILGSIVVIGYLTRSKWMPLFSKGADSEEKSNYLDSGGGGSLGGRKGKAN